MKYYSDEAKNGVIPECSVYDFMFSQNKKYQNMKALRYFGKSITYKELFEKIEHAMLVLTSLGIKKGDIVGVITVAIPEFVYIFYALDRMGVIQNMIDPRTSADGINDYLEETEAKYLIVLDVLFPDIVNAIKPEKYQNIIYLSASDSLMGIKKHILRMFNKRKLNASVLRYGIYYSSIVINSAEDIRIETYNEDKCCVIIHTGGTTGSPKSVMLSDKNINALVWQSMHTENGMNRGESWLDIMPPFIAYGVGMGLHLPLSIGMETILIPQFDPFKFDDLIVKHKPNHMVGVPSYWNTIINSRKLDKMDLSYIVAPTVGGDTLDKNLEIRVNEFLREHGSDWKITKGYGMTEVCAGVCGTSKMVNELGSVGIPFVHSLISIFDSNTGEELQYNQEGEICITGPNVMLGYYNNSDETDKILRMHSDGKKWIHSGDIGYMDENGSLFVLGRMKRMIIRYDGFKIFPVQIEGVIKQNEIISDAAVVGIKDRNHSQGKLAYAFIVAPNIDDEKLINEVSKMCEEQLPEYARPIGYKVVNEIPLTDIGKVDYRKLEEMINND